MTLQIVRVSMVRDRKLCDELRAVVTKPVSPAQVVRQYSLDASD